MHAKRIQRNIGSERRADCDCECGLGSVAGKWNCDLLIRGLKFIYIYRIRGVIFETFLVRRLGTHVFDQVVDPVVPDLDHRIGGRLY